MTPVSEPVRAQGVNVNVTIPKTQPFGVQYQRKNIHNGNRVKMGFYNSGLIAQTAPDVAWPVESNIYLRDVSVAVLIEKVFADTFVNVQQNFGTRLRDNASVNFNPAAVSSRFTLPDGRAAVAVADTSVYVTSNPAGRINNSWVKNNTGTGALWSFTPYDGFLNPLRQDLQQNDVAMSHLPDTWPRSWPDKIGDATYLNPVTGGTLWNGYFGAGITNADQESFFFATDATDEFWFRQYGYLPDPAFPSIKGAGLVLKVRGLQFSSFLAQDNIFLLYEITNRSVNDYEKVLFGSVVGTEISASSNNTLSAFDQSSSITYSYLRPNVPIGSGFVGAPGYSGLAFLESPGNAFDGIDNDDDAIPEPGVDLYVNQRTPPQFNTQQGTGAYDYTRIVTPTDTSFIFRRQIRAGEPVIVIEKVKRNIPRYNLDVTYYERKSVVMPNRDTTVISLGREYRLKPDTVLTEVSNNTFDDNLNGVIDENYSLHINRLRSRIDIANPTAPPVLVVQPPVRYKDYIALAQAGIPLNDAATYPMIDERRDDGIDNNANDEGNGQALDGTDVNEADQIGLTSFAIGPNDAFKIFEPDNLAEFVRPGRFDASRVATQTGTDDYMYGTGFFPLAAGQTERFSLGLVFGVNAQDVLDNRDIVQQIYDANYNFARPPTTPTLQVYTDDQSVTLHWDSVAEDYRDEFIRRKLGLALNTNDKRVKNFQGYRIYKSTDANFLDAFTVSGSQGQQQQQKAPIAQFDLKDDIIGNFPLTKPALLRQSKGISYYLGDNTGVRHSFTDRNVINGKTYFYAVVAYTGGDTALSLYPAENSTSARQTTNNNYVLGSNVVVATPSPKVAGYTSPDGTGGNAVPVGGPFGRATPVGSGKVNYIVVNPALLQSKTYQVEFIDTASDTIDNNGDDRNEATDVRERVEITSRFRLIDVTNRSQPDTLIRFSRGALNDSTAYSADVFSADGDIFRGAYLNVQNTIKNEYLPDSSGWTTASGAPKTVSSYSKPTLRTVVEADINTLGTTTLNINHPDDYEVEILSDGTGRSSPFKFPYFLGLLLDSIEARPTNFRVRNLTTGKPVRYFVSPALPKKTDAVRLDSVTTEIVLCESETDGGIDTLFAWKLFFEATGNKTALPQVGDKYVFRTTKPLRSGDKFEFSTNPVLVSNEAAKNQLDRVKVVPNPYVAASQYEPALLPGVQSGRGERRLRFTRVPKNSTIRIYTIRGELVTTLRQTGVDGGDVLWNLRSSENIDIAYGLYLYHLDAPEVGTKTGKFVLIK